MKLKYCITTQRKGHYGILRRRHDNRLEPVGNCTSLASAERILCELNGMHSLLSKTRVTRLEEQLKYERKERKAAHAELFIAKRTLDEAEKELARLNCQVDKLTVALEDVSSVAGEDMYYRDVLRDMAKGKGPYPEWAQKALQGDCNE